MEINFESREAFNSSVIKYLLEKFEEEEKIQRIKKVYEIFSFYFGEDKVDIQLNLEEIGYYEDYTGAYKYNSFFLTENPPESLKEELSSDMNLKALLNQVGYKIYIFYPKVTITNEYNSSIDVKKLFVVTEFSENSILRTHFKITRTDFTVSQLRCGYIHSHCPGFNSGAKIGFMSPCLGSGPIKDTCLSLMVHYDEDKLMLFCRELDLYVKTESVSGVPYIRLDSVNCGGFSKNVTRYLFNQYDKALLTIESKKNSYDREIFNLLYKEIIRSKVLKFRTADDKVLLAEKYDVINLKLSNLCIKLLNKFIQEKVFTRDVIDNFYDTYFIEYVIENNVLFYITNRSNINRNLYDDDKIVYFKDKWFKFNLIKEENKKILKLLDTGVVSFILSRVLEEINIKYSLL